MTKELGLTGVEYQVSYYGTLPEMARPWLPVPLVRPSHLLIYCVDMRLHPLRRLHPHASPIQPLSLPYRPPLALPPHHYDSMGHRFRLQRCHPLIWRSGRSPFLLRVCRSSVLPWLSLLPVELVHAQGACTAHGYAVCWEFDQWSFLWTDRCGHHERIGWCKRLGRLALAVSVSSLHDPRAVPAYTDPDSSSKVPSLSSLLSQPT